MNKLITNLALGVAFLATPFVLAGTTPTSFAIVIDDFHGNQLTKELSAYQKSLEKEGFKVYILKDKWQQPEQIKNKLFSIQHPLCVLYRNK